MNQSETTETVALWQSPLLAEQTWLRHGVTERTGGVSSPPFASLNLGLHVGDDAGHVQENRRRLAASLGLELSQMVCAEQVHGNRAAVATTPEAGRGSTTWEDALTGADALVTEEPDLLLTLFFADCLPVLLADTEQRVVAVAHAGWRGLVGGVIENSLQTMAERFGSRGESVLAAIGPGIGPCCFEVGPEVAAHFPASVVRQSVSQEGKPHVNLTQAARLRLLQAGISADRIESADLCTACHTDRFFSHRRENGRTGRMGAFIAKRR